LTRLATAGSDFGLGFELDFELDGSLRVIFGMIRVY